METQKRERSANFNVAEVELLVNLVTKYKHVIENKKTDAVTNKDKENTWKKIEHSFNSCGISQSVRSWKTLKLKYEGIKKNTKKKSSLQRQEMYKTGGGPSNAPDFSVIDEKVLNICSNIKGMDARNDSDSITFSESIPVEEVIKDDQLLLSANLSFSETLDEQETANTEQADVQVPDMNESLILDINMEDDSQKENKWIRWHPKTLKTRVTNVLKTNTATKASVTSNLDKLSTARLELVQLQMEIARKELQFKEEEHKLKMLHLANDERRKEEVHAVLIQKMKCGTVSNDMI